MCVFYMCLTVFEEFWAVVELIQLKLLNITNMEMFIKNTSKCVLVIESFAISLEQKLHLVNRIT